MKSMTAFGRASAVRDSFEITVELRSVNNRFLDWSLRLPRAYAALEDTVKNALTATGISRGKIDVTVTVTDTRAVSETGAPVLQPDLDCARRTVEAAALLSAELGIPNDMTATRLMAMPGVMVPVRNDQTEDDDVLWARLEPVVADAAAQFLAARQREGERLGADLLEKLAGIRVLVNGISEKSAGNIAGYREKFEERLRALIGESGAVIDESRIVTECAVYADRVAIDEELVRLSSHFDALETLFRSDEPVGRRIDFMLQETNREINTIGSKCSDADIARTVAEVKSEFEKIREQIQNIE